MGRFLEELRKFLVMILKTITQSKDFLCDDLSLPIQMTLVQNMTSFYQRKPPIGGLLLLQTLSLTTTCHPCVLKWNCPGVQMEVASHFFHVVVFTNCTSFTQIKGDS